MEMDPNKRLFSTRVFCDAAYGRANIADNSYFSERRCRYLPLWLFPPILFTLSIPLTIVFVGKSATMNAYLEQMERFTLNFGMLKNYFAKYITKECVTLYV